MKFGELGKWVGLHGTTLQRRARLFGHDFKLKDLLTTAEAGKMYRQLPLEQTLTITYTDARNPKIEFVGSWNAREWQRMIRKVEHAILLRHRDFSRACRKNERIDAVEAPKVSDPPVSVEATEVVGPVEYTASTQLMANKESETVTSISALVEADAKSLEEVEFSPEEYSHAGRENTASAGTSAIPSNTRGSDSAGPEPGRDPERRECAVAVSDGCADSDTGDTEGSG